MNEAMKFRVKSLPLPPLIQHSRTNNFITAPCWCNSNISRNISMARFASADYNTLMRPNNKSGWREWIPPTFYGVSCLISLMNSVTATPTSLTLSAANHPAYTDSIITQNKNRAGKKITSAVSLIRIIILIRAEIIQNTRLFKGL